MQRLDCHVQKYAWGKKGSNSYVAQIYEAGHPQFKTCEKTCYSELWMGTHPDGPARVRGSSASLSEHIAKSESAEYLTNNNQARRDVHLPFIMKLMSIDRTLSLQVHPTKEQAVRLHARDPVHYPDRHHKPELAYALTTFELLCGFRPAEEMLQNVQAFPSLRELFGEEECAALCTMLVNGDAPRCLKVRAALAACFQHAMDASDDAPLVHRLCKQLIQEMDRGVRGALTESTVGVIRKMTVDFPGDAGIFSPLYLNHMILQPGECCYYAAEELHAYLSGECVECVGCSNNTIRAALTPKFVDREALCEVLNYRMTAPEEYLVPARTLPAYPAVDEYAPDCKDFQLHRVRVSTACSDRLPALDCASIMVVVEGAGRLSETGREGEEMDGRMVDKGDIIYIPPGRRISMRADSAIEAYRTFSYELGPDHEARGPSRAADEVKKTKTINKIIDCDAMSKPIFTLEADMDGFC